MSVIGFSDEAEHSGEGALDLGEPVAHPAHGLDIAGVLRIWLYLAAYVLDVDVGCPCLAEEVPIPEMAHDLLPPIDPSGVGGQERQDLELPGGELHEAPAGEDLPPEQVHLEPGNSSLRCSVPARELRRWRRRCARTRLINSLGLKGLVM